MDVVGCLACDLTAGRRPLPGGAILEGHGWRIEHCVGPLGVGTLLLKPLRHVTRVAELTGAEAAAQGPMIHTCAAVVEELLSPAQTYVCLWSHAGGQPVHIHYVIQPVTSAQIANGVYGPRLQVDMFSAGQLPDAEQVESFAEAARRLLRDTSTPAAGPRSLRLGVDGTLKIDEARASSDALLAAVRRLVVQLSTSARIPSQTELEELISSPACRLLTARDRDDHILGMLTLVVFRIPTGVRAWIEDVVVDENARGRGVGGQLIAEAIKLARDAGARTVDLTSRPEREAANALYRRAGFALRDSNLHRITF